MATTALSVRFSIYVFQHPDFIGEMRTPDGLLFTIAPVVFFFACTIFLLLMPSFQAGKPSLRILLPTPEYLAEANRNLYRKPNNRKEAIRSAPTGLRRWIRVFHWSFPAYFVLGTTAIVLGKFFTLPAPLSWIDAAIHWMGDNDAMISVSLGVLIPILVAETILIRRAKKLYQRHVLA
jgi:hypothetical protein